MILIPASTIDDVVVNLIRNGGVTTVSLPDGLAKSNKRAFEIASKALDTIASREKEHGREENIPTSSSVIPAIEPNSNSATVTGYHSAGGTDSLSRYNLYREGFIFSNGESFDIPLSDSDCDTNDERGRIMDENMEGDNKPSFKGVMDEMFDGMCNVIAKSTLRGIARYLKLEDEDWFENVYGPMDKSSQWHVKRYVEPSALESKSEIQVDSRCNITKTNRTGENNRNNDGEEQEQEIEWLPAHTDPSLISVIIHDAPGYNENAMGLQYQCSIQSSNKSNNEKKKRVWKEVECHGHSVATIFSGSVISLITGGLFASAKHRVVYKETQGMKYRQAATLFLRPRPESVLTVPPCTLLMERAVKVRKNLHFSDWLNKVSKNYQGAKNQKVAQRARHKNRKEPQKNIRKEGIDPIYWSDDHTELTLHGATPPLCGKDKYLGGELCSLNEHIYTIPGFSTRVIDIDTTKDPPQLNLIGPELRGEYKWLRGIPIGDRIYGIPCHADSVLKIKALTNEVELLKWNDSAPKATPNNQKWKYHGAAVSDYNGCIYCIPQASEHVLKIDPTTDELSFIGPPFPGINKWYGGTLLEDGCIYGVCQNATGILRIDPRTEECTMHGNFPQGSYKWHGGVSHPNGNLYCIPAHADTVLKVEPGLEPKLSLLGNNLKTGEHRKDGKYKFLGGAVSKDYIYFFPSDADYVLEINTITDKVREVGPNLRNIEPMRCNKWQNGFSTKDGVVYGIPLKGHTVLRIIPGAEEPKVECIGGPYPGFDKWEGGVTASNGDMYCVPLNHKFSLRIRHLK